MKTKSEPEKELVLGLTEAARLMTPEVVRHLGRTAAPPAASAALTAPASSPRFRSRAWIPLVGAAVLAGVGAGLFVQANNDHAQLVSPTTALLDPARARAVADEGKLLQPLGVGLIAAGVAALGVGAGMFFLGSESTVSPTVALAGGYPAFGLSGSFR